VEPNQKKYPWYHQQFRRVPTIDQCYADDVVCDFEATAQFKRDRLDLLYLNFVFKRL
jgi:NADH dehydrogenase (ubiquinone) 1 beta subcomplex subunit 10